MPDYIPSPRQWVRDQVELYERSGGTEGTTLRDTGLPVIVVTHTGNKTGAIRKTPLMRVTDGASYVLVGSMGGAPTNPVWVHNLRANPDVEIRDHTVAQPMRVREEPHLPGGGGQDRRHLRLGQPVSEGPHNSFRRSVAQAHDHLVSSGHASDDGGGAGEAAVAGWTSVPDLGVERHVAEQGRKQNRKQGPAPVPVAAKPGTHLERALEACHGPGRPLVRFGGECPSLHAGLLVPDDTSDRDDSGLGFGRVADDGPRASLGRGRDLSTHHVGQGHAPRRCR